MKKNLKYLLKILLTCLIISFKQKNCLLKTFYLQTIFAAEKCLPQGLNFAQWQTSSFEMSLTDLEGTCKLTVSEMDEQLFLFLETLMGNKIIDESPPGLQY
jgi:hypothetical protein